MPANTACACTAFPTHCLAALQAHHWPGNVRELQNVIERAVILCGDAGLLEPEHLGFSPLPPAHRTLRRPAPALPPPLPLLRRPLPRRLRRDLMFPGRSGEAPYPGRHGKDPPEPHPCRQVLGISIRTLRNKLNEYGVPAKYGDAPDTPDSAEPAELPTERS